MPKKSRNRKGNQYLKKATGLKAAQLIKQGNVRAAARMIGHYIDPENPVAAGKKRLSPKVLTRAAAIYKDQSANKKSLGRAAAKEIARAKTHADAIRVIDNFKPTNLLSSSLTKHTKIIAAKKMSRNLQNATALIEGGKVARTAARGAGVFGIAAMAAQHLAGEMRKKKG